MKKLILTPECQDLWVLSPSMLFNYDRIVIDSVDYVKIASPEKENSLSSAKARLMQQLREYELVETVNYRDLLDESDRLFIHHAATEKTKRMLSESSSDFFESDFVRLALHSHLEYGEYLKSCIVFTDTEDKYEIDNHLTRLEKIKSRIDSIRKKKVSDEDVEAIASTLSRISAKSLASLIISKRSGIESFYDTREYAPFIGTFEEDTKVEFDHNPEFKTFDIVVAAFTRRKIPLVTDRSKMFFALQESSEFETLKQSLRKIEEYIGNLVESQPDLARDKIEVDIARLNEEYLREFDRIRNKGKVKFTWKAAEMVTSQFLGFVNPLISDVRAKSEQITRDEIRKENYSGDDFKSHLFYVSELWNRVPQEELSRRVHDRTPSVSKSTIWGEDNSELPWYENTSMSNKTVVATANAAPHFDVS